MPKKRTQKKKSTLAKLRKSIRAQLNDVENRRLDYEIMLGSGEMPSEAFETSLSKIENLIGLNKKGLLSRKFINTARKAELEEISTALDEFRKSELITETAQRDYYEVIGKSYDKFVAKHADAKDFTLEDWKQMNEIFNTMASEISGYRYGNTDDIDNSMDLSNIYLTANRETRENFVDIVRNVFDEKYGNGATIDDILAEVGRKVLEYNDIDKKKK